MPMAREEAPMSNRCCAGEVTHALACHDCGASCCAACVIHLESVTYCSGCARALLGTNVVHATEPFTFF